MRHVLLAFWGVGCMLSACSLSSVPATAAEPPGAPQQRSTSPPLEADTAAHLSEWHTAQAQTSLEQRKFPQALAHAKRALAVDPNNRSAKRLLAQAQHAVDELQRRLAQKTQLMAQAVAAERKGDAKQALTFWKRAYALDREDARIQAALSALRVRLNTPATIKRAEDLRTMTPKTPLVEEYYISPGDVLEVFVWQQPDLTRDVIVRPDGRLSFPLVGDVQAAGMTLTQVDTILTERLKTYLKFPDVSLAIKRFGGTKTIVMGEVARPGVYVPAGEGRALEVVAMAGGFTKDAEQGHAMLIRGGLLTPQVAKLNLAKALNRGALEENVVLQPNDILFIPKSGIRSTLDFMEKFYPTISEILVGQSIATNFGVKETSGAAAR